MAEFMDQFNQWFAGVNRSLDEFGSFLIGKLKNFKNLTLGEQISYVCIALGFVLILTSIILFIL